MKSLRRVNAFNNLYFYFMVTQLGFFFTPYFSRPPLEIDFDVRPALACHTMALCCFSFGYVVNLLFDRWRAKPVQPDRQHSFAPEFYFACYVMVAFGVFVTVLQVARFRSPADYVNELLTGGFNINIRNEYLAPSSEGGISGALKMFGSVPLAMYLATLGMLHFLNFDAADRGKLERLNRYALWGTGFKVLFALDRLTIVAFLISNLFITFRTRKHLGYKFLGFAVTILLVEFVSRRRVADIGVLDFIVLYYNLGIANLQLLLDSMQGYTYGFKTIFSAVPYIGRFFGYTDLVPVSTYDFRYVGAQYFVGFAYQDFGYYLGLMFIALGYLYRTIDRRALTEKNIYYVSLYFIMLFNTVSFAAVPAFTSVDFWAGLFTPLLLMFFFNRRIRSRSDKTPAHHRQRGGHAGKRGPDGRRRLKGVT